MKNIFLFCLVLLWLQAFSQGAKTLLFAGTYTGGLPAKGIYIYAFDVNTGALTLKGAGEKIVNPSYITISRNGQYLYACTETKMQAEGNISAFKINSVKNTLSFISKQKAGGSNPVYVNVNPVNGLIVCANYGSGNAGVFGAGSNGGLNPYMQLLTFKGGSVIAGRQEASHPHAAVFTPDGQYVLFPDLGSDCIRSFRFNTQHAKPLEESSAARVVSVPGSGPRHLVFAPNGNFAYCIEELSGTVSVYRYKNGRLDSIQRIVSYSKSYNVYSSADIHLSPDGKFLYASNRSDDENTIAIFSVDPGSGRLRLLAHQPCGGEHPRNFIIAPGGKWLLVANMLTNNIVVFKRDTHTGLLSKTSHVVNVPSPSCLQMYTYGK